MDRAFLGYYEMELEHLRRMGAEFARAYPKVASRLNLEEFKCLDPYVERLLEGFAFLTARIQYKLDAEFPRFTQTLLDIVYPDYLAPTPSFALVQFHPNLKESALVEGFPLPRGKTLLKSLPIPRKLMGKPDENRCLFRTAHDVTLWPIEIVEAAYHGRDVGTLRLGGAPKQLKAALRIRLRCTLPGLTFSLLKNLDRLPLYLVGAESKPLKLYEQLLSHTISVAVRATSGSPPALRDLPKESVDRCGFDENQSLFPGSPRTFEGYRLLREYFAFPQRFLFLEVRGLKEEMRHFNCPEIDLIVGLKSLDPSLEGEVSRENFALFCTPAINLFEKRSDRVQVTQNEPEFRVDADKTRPLDYEVYRVQRVIGYGVGLDEKTEFRPFFQARDPDLDPAGRSFYSVRRVRRELSEREKEFGLNVHYPGSEVYLSLVDTQNAPFSEELRQLEVVCLCTNRGLPLNMAVGQADTDFEVDGDPPVVSVRCLHGPTVPAPSHAEGELAWRLINHLSLNYLLVSDSAGSEGAEVEQGGVALRNLLSLYVDLGKDVHGKVPDHLKKEVDGVRSVQNRRIMRRLEDFGAITFVNGQEVSVTFEESFYGGNGAFLLGAVLESFFSKMATINSFTETVVKTVERGEIKRWPARQGRKRFL